MKICIINPPLQNMLKQEEEWSNLLPTTYRYFDIEYMRAFLNKNRIDVEVYDCIADDISLNMLKAELIEHRYDVTLVFVYYYNRVNFERLLSFLKKHVDTYLVVGGDEVELTANNVMIGDDFIKAVILGNKEKAFLDVINNLHSDIKVREKISGTTRSKIISCPEENNSLKEKPLIQHKFTMKGNSVTILTSRGCYGDCIFCAEKEIYSKSNKEIIQQRTVQQVIEEICIIEKKLSPRYIYICDSNFMPSMKIRKEWLQRFILELRKRECHSHFSALLRANDVIYYEELIPQLKEVGFTCLYVGIESFVQRQLDFYNKHITVEENIHAINIILKSGMKINFTFLFLDPYTTIKEIRENLKTMKELNIYSYITYDQPFFSMTCTVNSIPGTRLSELIKRNNLVLRDSKGYKFLYDEVTQYYEALKAWNRILGKYDYIRFLVDKDWALYEGKHYTQLCNIIAQMREVDINCCIDLLNIYEHENETKELLNHNEKLMCEIIKNINI